MPERAAAEREILSWRSFHPVRLFDSSGLRIGTAMLIAAVAYSSVMTFLATYTTSIGIVVSGRTPREHVRAVDGVTAYHMVTGNPNALFELIRAFPYVLQRAFGSGVTTGGSSIEDAMAAHLIADALPTRSVYCVN